LFEALFMAANMSSIVALWTPELMSSLIN
jgi:hypothetical protein